MKNLLKDIAAAIEAAAAKQEGLPPWQAGQEIAVNCKVAARWVESYERGRPADAILNDLASEAEKAEQILKGDTEEARENARKRPGLPDGMFSTECAAIASYLIAGYLKGQEARNNRLQLVKRLAKEVLEKHPQAKRFGGESAVAGPHFLRSETVFQNFTQLRKDAYSEEAFREKLRAKLAALKADIDEKHKLYNPEAAHLEDRHRTRDAYLMALFQNNLLVKYLTALFPEQAKPGQPAAGQAQPFGEELERVVRAALKKRGLLDNNGHFTGDYTQVKALFVVLHLRGYLPKKSKKRGAELLAALFEAQFNFDFAPRTITGAEKYPNIGQDREERLFTGAIPERK